MGIGPGGVSIHLRGGNFCCGAVPRLAEFTRIGRGGYFVRAVFYRFFGKRGTKPTVPRSVTSRTAATS
jgi:hypothetical protein